MRNGFTLIELLVVIAMIGVLASLVLIAVNPLAQIERANEAKKKAAIAQIGNAIERYHSLNGIYPQPNNLQSSLLETGELKVFPENGTATDCTSTEGQGAILLNGFCYNTSEAGSSPTMAVIYAPSNQELTCPGGSAWYAWSALANGTGLTCTSSPSIEPPLALTEFVSESGQSPTATGTPPTATSIPTNTPTPEPTLEPTPVSSPTATLIPTATPTEVPTPTPTSTPTPSPTPTLTPTPTPTLTPTPTPLSYKKVFLTNVATGNLSGLTGANNTCATAATSNGHSGTFLAWLSNGTTPPSTSFMQSAIAYKLVDGTTTIANNWADLIDGTLLAPINKNAAGTTVGTVNVWTNVNFNGTSIVSGSSTSGNCSAWTSGAGSRSGRIGSSGSTTSTWTNTGSTLACSNAIYIYCFQQ